MKFIQILEEPIEPGGLVEWVPSVPGGLGGWLDDTRLTSHNHEQHLRDAFDVLYAEGGEGQPKMLSVGLHCRLAGRPARARSLERFLDHVQSHERVWITRRIDIARHWVEHFPAP